MFLNLVLATEPMYDGYYNDGNYYGDYGNVIYPRTNSQSQRRALSESEPRTFNQSEPRNFSQPQELDSSIYLTDSFVLTNQLAFTNQLPPVGTPSGMQNQNGEPMGIQNFGFEYDR